jgi:outer membrane receptor protein involved in Fe transport
MRLLWEGTLTGNSMARLAPRDFAASMARNTAAFSPAITTWPGDPAGFGPLAWNQTVRDPVNLVDLRLGVRADDWSVTFWSKNLFDEEYNDEFSHPFVWKALPRRWGLQYTKDF